MLHNTEQPDRKRRPQQSEFTQTHTHSIFVFVFAIASFRAYSGVSVEREMVDGVFGALSRNYGINFPEIKIKVL